MEERPRYFVLLIISIMIASSIYISWATDRAQGKAYYQSETIKIDGPLPYSTTEVSFDLYRPRPSGYFAPYPIVLTIHGIGGSKEMMYAFNVELARRNFTVVSVDLPGHGRTTESFDYSDFERMAEICYSVLDYVWDTYPGIDNSTYGIVAHSMGVGVAFAMANMEIAPSPIVAVGSDGNLGFGEPPAPRCNLLFAIGSSDELVSNEDALAALRNVSGNSSAVPDVTYGSFSYRNATRLVFAPSGHIQELVDSTIVSESIRWMILSLQNEVQLNRTASVNELIYHAKTYGTVVGTISLFFSLFPLMLIANSLIQKVLPYQLPTDKVGYSMKMTTITSIILGIMISVLFSIVGLFYVNSTLTYSAHSEIIVIGFLTFSILVFIMGSIISRFLLGSTTLQQIMKSEGIGQKLGRSEILVLIRGVALSAICILWLFAWVSLASNVSGYEFQIIYPVIRPLAVERMVIVILLVLILLPFTLFDSLWTRGLLMKLESSSGWTSLIRKLIMTGVLKSVGFLIPIIPFFAFTSLYHSLSGPCVLLGLFYIIFTAAFGITTLITIWSDHIKTELWTPTILNAVIYSWVFLTIIPMI